LHGELRVLRHDPIPCRQRLDIEHHPHDHAHPHGPETITLEQKVLGNNDSLAELNLAGWRTRTSSP